MVQTSYTILTLVLGFTSYSCNSYNIIFVPSYSYWGITRINKIYEEAKQWYSLRCGVISSSCLLYCKALLHAAHHHNMYTLYTLTNMSHKFSIIGCHIPVDRDISAGHTDGYTA